MSLKSFEDCVELFNTPAKDFVIIDENTDFSAISRDIIHVYVSGEFSNSYFPAPTYSKMCKRNILMCYDLLKYTKNTAREVNILNYIGYIFDTLAGSKTEFINLNEGQIKYHPNVIAHTPSAGDDVQARFNLFCARSNLRHLCEKATVVLLTWLILEAYD
jgi:hypothetical protein